MAGNNGGPWGGGGGNRGNGEDEKRPGEDRRPPTRRPGEGPQIPEIDELMNKGREQLRVLMGGGKGGTGPGNTGGGPRITRGTIGLAGLAVLGLWAFMSFYTVRPEEQSVELFLGQRYSVGEPGLNFAPWPLVTYDVVNVTSERTESIGTVAGAASDAGLMLTTDANIVDIGFQVVWNVNNPQNLLFNISDPQLTVQAVSESVMREIIAASTFSSILNRDRGAIADTAQANIQATLDEYESGISIVRINLEKAEPPPEVIDSFRAVQAAAQERDRLQRQADAYSNTVLAEARGRAAQIVEQAEGYRAQTINDALGQASRFAAVQTAYEGSQDITRRRIYLETMERVLGDVNKIILDPSVAGGEGGSGVVPFLPLNELMRTPSGPAAASTGTGN
jgi:modulator of FtsH protease HflK